ncbi:choice-of-anchor I family protein [Mucilaginibacter myungsuensis]|uniref:Choice-of-anchor I family protein n=1 Tax=Mucilaginibacter myungsuensis TaxID=649104 RepID=A0A929KTE8_9SPHI|nr:choice-of-anchor I family protein [Mucilaginibacter myungsuensis]MBE9661224.1 choice-of-anchor I family protein [Mucilaginibacter myungsuensis]MDN3597368.1 choice-of-anchor I family protein [Mucilaginibacter myungsuensis]
MKKTLLAIALSAAFFGCKKNTTEVPFIDPTFVNEDPSTFAEIGSIDIGDVGAAEITAFDPATKRLFVVNNSTVNKIDVIDFADPTKMTVINSISMAPYGGAVNSVAVSNGKLAAAIESTNKQADGKVAVFNTNDLKEVKVITVGALPDMITYSPDGKYIMTANEGEPNDTYANDPAGTVSIITVDQNYAVTTIDFSSMVGQRAALIAGGFRIFGIGNDFVKDIEPEYVTISADSKTAWVTLQENNGIAKIDIASKTITNIFPLGFKDYNVAGNEIDPSDRDNAVGLLAKWPVKGIYMPDAIALLEKGGVPYMFTANEGDAREYSAFAEVARVKDLRLDATAFPTGTALKADAQIGRLNVTTTLGDTDGDGDYDALYSLGARSFSIWNGLTGKRIFDSQNDLDIKALATGPGVYDDTRSDDKSVEPEGITIGKVGNKDIAVIGMERADAVAVYDVTNPARPTFLQMFKCGDAPEGVLLIPAKDSPTKKSLLIVSSENDGLVKVYTPKTF